MLQKAINSVRIGIVTWTTVWVGETFRFPIQKWHVWVIYAISVGAIAWVCLREESKDNPQTTEGIIEEIFERTGAKVSVGDLEMKPVVLFSHREELS
jgi:hypothetical protein